MMRPPSWSVAPPDPPIDPTAGHARSQLGAELAKPQYEAARPSALSVALNAVQRDIARWLDNLFDGLTGPTVSPTLIVVIVAALLLAALLVAFFVFGLPRINRRGAAPGALFGEDDDRDSVALRHAAERAADAGDYGTAIAEGFRSIARALAERTIVRAFPGTTAAGFSRQAADAFPDLGTELARGADAFDGVRYLGAGGTESDWLALSALARELRDARPAPRLDEVDA